MQKKKSRKLWTIFQLDMSNRFFLNNFYLKHIFCTFPLPCWLLLWCGHVSHVFIDPTASSIVMKIHGNGILLFCNRWIPQTFDVTLCKQEAGRREIETSLRMDHGSAIYTQLKKSNSISFSRTKYDVWYMFLGYFWLRILIL